MHRTIINDQKSNNRFPFQPEIAKEVFDQPEDFTADDLTADAHEAAHQGSGKSP